MFLFRCSGIWHNYSQKTCADGETRFTLRSNGIERKQCVCCLSLNLELKLQPIPPRSERHGLEENRGGCCIEQEPPASSRNLYGDNRQVIAAFDRNFILLIVGLGAD